MVLDNHEITFSESLYTQEENEFLGPGRYWGSKNAQNYLVGVILD